jgi:hypothetical protein
MKTIESYMNPLFEKITRFLRKEWFLIVMAATILLLVYLFEVL